MARSILIITSAVLLNVFVLVGCDNVDRGQGQIIPAEAKQAQRPMLMPTAGEVDLIEQMAASRLAYRNGLEVLIDYYSTTGNYMKLEWAKKELSALDVAAQYNYIIEAGVAGPELKATDSIAAADDLFDEARSLHRRGDGMLVIRHANLLRLALEKYNTLINKYPTSDKIDDAAYRCGEIYEYFKDYSIAVLYYIRSVQWNTETPYPASFRAAFLLDRKLSQREEALDLYKHAVQVRRANESQLEFAEFRIKALNQSAGEEI